GAEDNTKRRLELHPGSGGAFGEIIFKNQEFPEKIAGAPPSLYSPSLDAIFDVISEMGAAAVVHCDHDTPYNLALRNDPAASMIFQGASSKPQYLEGFKAFLKRHPYMPTI